MTSRLLCGAALLAAAGVALAAAPAGPPLTPAFATEAVPGDADDPAIWIHPRQPERSLILGTDKGGALAIFTLEGKLRTLVRDLARPNNVDVEYGFPLGGRTVDLAVLTERERSRLRAFAIDRETGELRDVSSEGLAMFGGEAGERAAPMGVALYRRPRDGAIFAVVSRKEGPAEGLLWQYRLRDDGRGRVTAAKVREFGSLVAGGEVEAVAVDDELGWLYYAEENAGVHKWPADPDAPDAGRELALFAREGYEGDREGLALWLGPDGGGYLLCTDQRKGGSLAYVYSRAGEPGRRHDHSRVLAAVPTGADDTDGLEVTSAPLGPRFPRGLMVTMNSRGRNFLAFDWRACAELLTRP